MNTIQVDPNPAVSGQEAKAHGDGYASNRDVMVHVKYPNGTTDSIIDFTTDGHFHCLLPGVAAGSTGLGTGSVWVTSRNGETLLANPVSFDIKGSM